MPRASGEGTMRASGDHLDRICTIRIEPMHSDPLIWREVKAPVSITLDDLHRIIRIAMDWAEEHLWEFIVAKKRYAPPDEFTSPFEPVSDSGEVRLSDMLRQRRTTFQYLYDFGDSWLHQVIVTRIRAPETGVAYPRYIAGERNSPLEDIGGLPGFYAGLAAVAEDEEIEELDDLHGWARSFDPDYIDEDDIEKRLRLMAEVLRTQKKKPRKKKAKTGPVLGDDAELAAAVNLMLNALKLGAASRPRKPRVGKRM
jgi:hypothetical protein